MCSTQGAQYEIRHSISHDLAFYSLSCIDIYIKIRKLVYKLLLGGCMGHQGTDKKKYWRSGALSLLLCICATHAEAGRLLKVATGEWPPYLSAELPGSGCIASMVKEAFELEAYQVEYHFLPWSRGYIKTKQGHYDVNMYWYRSQQRDKDFMLSKQNISLERLGFYYLKSLGLQGQSYAEFSGKTLVLNPGFTYPDKLWDEIKHNNIKVLEARTESQNFQLMFKGRADATILTEKLASAYLSEVSQENSNKVQSAKEMKGFVTGHILFSKAVDDTEALRDAFDRGFVKLMSNSEYKYNYQKNCSQF